MSTHHGVQLVLVTVAAFLARKELQASWALELVSALLVLEQMLLHFSRLDRSEAAHHTAAIKTTQNKKNKETTKSPLRFQPKI